MRIYHPITLTPGESVELDAKASHHIRTVMRAKENDPITLFNGEGGEYAGILTHLSKKKVIVHIASFSPREAESPLTLYLAQGLSRGEKMDFTIQKAVELGIQKIIPLLTDRSTLKLTPDRLQKRMQHWESIVIHAAEQCGRNRLPAILPPMTLSELLTELPAEWYFILNPANTPSVPLSLQKNHRIVMIIGPEGGFSAQEMAFAMKNKCQSLNLGPRILRTETAGLAAITFFQSHFGDMQNFWNFKNA